MLPHQIGTSGAKLGETMEVNSIDVMQFSPFPYKIERFLGNETQEVYLRLVYLPL